MTKNFTISFLTIIFLILLTPGCKNWFSPVKPKTITAIELEEQLRTDKDLLVINIADEEEFDKNNIKQSINIPYDALDDMTNKIEKNRTIVLHSTDQNCPKAKKAFQMLHKQKFKNLVLFEGGTNAWLKEGFETDGYAKNLKS